ncbi:MAG: VWA domain-containing protein [Parachlamydia sp.]|nr:VWA domain-containing protein [Parachlamydia sp.]
MEFSHPLWLIAGLALPLVWAAFFLFDRVDRPQLEKFIDKHLLPYLLLNPFQKRSVWSVLLLWSAVWSLLTVALAGPRWNYQEIETFTKEQNLVILLDLSSSMQAADLKPSRLVRARQKIEDLLNLSQGVKIGLIAFAADPHMITPLTEDKETIRHLLPTLDTDLIYVQGSRLSPALEMASQLLEAEPGSSKSLLVISDGGFEDTAAIKTARRLAEKGVVIHALGIGTVEGAPVKDQEGNVVKKNGSPVLSKLERERFSEISKAGHGHYLEVHDKEEVILKELEKRAEAQIASGKKHRIWEERYYLLILPALPILLWWFRRGALFTLILFFPFSLSASDYFKNSEQLGKEAFEAGDHATAIASFQDPYRKGVACYRAGQYAEAEKLFRQSSRPDVACSAVYNLGNALAHQQKYKEAIEAYENVLKQWPDHTRAKENLELVKKMLEQQQQQQQQQQDQNKKDKEKEQQDQNKQDSGSDNKENEQDSSSENKQEENKQEKQNQEQESKPEEQDSQKQEPPSEEKSQEDQDADVWLNRIQNDPKTFMKNKFQVESKKNGTTEGIDPW